MRPTRRITTHELDGQAGPSVFAHDDGMGSAPHRYAIGGFDPAGNPHADGVAVPLVLAFQSGPAATAGVDGVTMEALLAVVADRLAAFQAGPTACRENERALGHVEEALHWLHARTRDRRARGVAGTYQA